LTEHNDIITTVLRGAQHLGFALGPALARAGSGCSTLPFFQNLSKSSAVVCSVPERVNVTWIICKKACY